MNYKTEIKNRIDIRLKRSLIDFNTKLAHFSIISYKVPLYKIKHLIPSPFKLWTFNENGVEYALISAVPFKDKDFCLYRILRFIKFSFFQTNFRAYIIDTRNNTHCAWFFGTTLGSITSIIPKYLWNMPWSFGKYKTDFVLNENKYLKYHMDFVSKQGHGKINITSSEKEMRVHQGFNSLEEQEFILTHPIVGYYHNLNNRIGTFEIWHPKMKLFEGHTKDA